MGSFKAVRSQINVRIKCLAGWHYRGRIRRAWTMSADEFWAHQRRAFQDVYRFAVRHVPYYRDRPEQYPPDLGEEPNVLDTLHRLPVLSKQTIREHNQALWASPRPRLSWVSTTTGTTGTPLLIAASLWERAFGQNVEREWLRRITGSPHPRTLHLTGMLVPTGLDRDLYWRDWLFGDIYLSIYALGPKNRAAIVELIRRFKPQCIFGYTSSVNQLATLVGDSVKDAARDCVALTTCEVLQPSWRENIEAKLCSRLYDFYGSQEGCHRVDQCREGRMHIHPLVGIVEIVDADHRPVRAGEIGQVLVTGLTRRTMPLIRCEIGDAAESTGYATDCPCGLAWPTLGRIEGRSEDLVRMRDGRVISVLCDRVTKGLDGIEECQLVQKDYERFVFRIVQSKQDPAHYQALEAQIQSRMAQRLQVDFELAFEYPSAIPRGNRGKFKAVVSEVATPSSPQA